MQPILIVNADDLGLSQSANAGIFHAHEQGIVSSASLVVTTPAADEAVRQLSKHPRLGIGLHFCLTAGRPVAAPADVPDLVDEEGYLRWRFGSLVIALIGPRRRVLLAQIARELDAQIARAQSFGLTLDHINGERHIHLIPGIFELVVQAAQRRRIPHVRLIHDIGYRYLTPVHALAAIIDGGIAKVAVLRLLTWLARRTYAPRGVVQVNYATLLSTGRMHRVMPSIWRNPPDGVTELAVHPGLPGEFPGPAVGNRELVRYLASSDRRREADICARLRSISSPARVATFGEIYGASGTNVSSKTPATPKAP